MDNRHHPFDVIFGSALGALLAWMAYRQYFPPLALAEGGRPYSIAEFATEKAERPAIAGYSNAAGYQPDLELGQTRQRRRDNAPQQWDGSEARTQYAGRGYSDVPQQTAAASFEDNTEYRR